ncbi:unnamed protein product [Adineta steineri]|uniref:Elongation of very long chain fatty acids protein n=2 Tax=Adineta steineri TaxID=433720 RepID=A0A814V5N4_9BILA|nr:unnamed protein product [Adineta steineri]
MKIYSSIVDPSHVTHRWVFDFELLLFQRENLVVIENFMYKWWWISIPYALLYIIAIFIGQEWMQKRNKKYELRGALILWNTFLALFSFWGACRCVPELLHSLTEHGFQHSLCDPILKEGITGLWLWLFIISKVPETIDTLFIVLRRQELIFLHWFHHASVLVYCFYSYGLFAPSGRWFTTINLCIHTIMYGYFALRAARFRIPRFIQQSITVFQLIQMIIGCIVNISAYKYKSDGYYCMTSYSNIIVSLLLYFAYLILFAYFFYTTYLQKRTKKRQD